MSRPNAQATPVAPPPAPADVGIVAAMPMEVAPLIARMSHVRRYASERHTIVEGEIAGLLVALIVAGVGRKAARRGTELLVGGHRPRWIVSAGYGGALNPALRRNQIVLAQEVLDTDGLRLAVDVHLPESAPNPQGFATGRLLTVDKIVRTASEKAELRRQYHQADIIDMETSAVAALCAERCVRFLGVRVVSDESEIDLPPEVLSIMGPTGSYRVGAAMAAIWKRPSSLKELLTLRDHAGRASQRLAEVLPGILARLTGDRRL